MGKILIPHGMKGELAMFFETSRVTIRRALNGITKTEFADRIRKEAIKRGCVEMRSEQK